MDAPSSSMHQKTDGQPAGGKHPTGMHSCSTVKLVCRVVTILRRIHLHCFFLSVMHFSFPTCGGIKKQESPRKQTPLVM